MCSCKSGEECLYKSSALDYLVRVSRLVVDAHTIAERLLHLDHLAVATAVDMEHCLAICVQVVTNLDHVKNDLVLLLFLADCVDCPFGTADLPESDLGLAVAALSTNNGEKGRQSD
jgi:hypothetical protein